MMSAFEIGLLLGILAMGYVTYSVVKFEVE